MVSTSRHELLKTPRLRGYLHQEAFFISLGACTLLIAKSTSFKTFIACLIYSFGLLLLFGVSACYHRIYWEKAPRALMKRLDHSAIFILIAGTFTPFCLLALPAASGDLLLTAIWLTSLFGILKSIFWVQAPKWLTAIIYVAAGWLGLPYLSQLYSVLGAQGMSFLFIGGVIYSIGAVCYALRRPNLIPNIFGYHELFHLLTIIAAAFHFAAIYLLIR